MNHSEPVDLLDGPPRHLERYAPPWASDRRTICGRTLEDVAAWVTFDEGKALIAKHGQTRARLLFCQTCVSRQRAVQQRLSWDSNPALVVHDWTQRATWGDGPAFKRTRAELLSLAQLVELHRGEYEAIVNAHSTDELAAKRKATR